MRRLRLPSRLIKVLFAGALVVLVCTIALRAQTTPDSDTFPDADDHFRYGSIGTEERVGLPYWIWKVLPTVFEDKLPKRPGVGWERIGFLQDDKRHARPIGTSYKDWPNRQGRAQLRDVPCRHRSGKSHRARAKSCRACPPTRWTCRGMRIS